jgi:hypothetical protein
LKKLKLQARADREAYEGVEPGSYSPLPRMAKVKANKKIRTAIKITKANRSRTNLLSEAS